MRRSGGKGGDEGDTLEDTGRSEGEGRDSGVGTGSEAEAGRGAERWRGRRLWRVGSATAADFGGAARQ